MIYQLLLCALFAVLAVYRPHRFEWGVLSILFLLTWVNTLLFGKNDVELYVIRSTLTMIAGSLLVVRWTPLSIYQALTLLLTLSAYGMLEFDVSQGEHVLIYNYYEAVIYGLVICHFLGIYPTLRDSYNDWITGRELGLEHLQRGSRS